MSGRGGAGRFPPGARVNRWAAANAAKAPGYRGPSAKIWPPTTAPMQWVVYSNGSPS